MAIHFPTISSIKNKLKRRNKYNKLERSPSEEELENSANEYLENKIREGIQNGNIVLVLPPPICRKCLKKL